RGASCLSDCVNGRTSSDQWDSVLRFVARPKLADKNEANPAEALKRCITDSREIAGKDGIARRDPLQQRCGCADLCLRNRVVTRQRALVWRASRRTLPEPWISLMWCPVSATVITCNGNWVTEIVRCWRGWGQCVIV